MYTNFSPHTIEPAIERRAELISQEAFSRPSTEPRVAVVVSFVRNLCQVVPDEAAILRREASAVLNYFQADGIDAVDVASPTKNDMDALLQDPTITDICLIGEGSLGSICVLDNAEDPASGVPYDWIDVSETADHLKTGSIYQRMCSVTRVSRVAWGTFAAADLRKVWISRQPNFEPETVHSDPTTGLMPVYERDTLSYKSLDRLAKRLARREDPTK
jgi:hypothetical protein